ncbi:hypothetical protein SCLCIDRAFT_537052 [Scleroderma citrinum Foug A]|uniref:Uncharacterized protein n=1 Tax=Scleroderma citrinum Foug A TaxID=1036808 RepID=A0A0C3EBB7_9AGAM|nr:hypothetical protein SCLCIDRAFT_537052 [Scleroderma citrinum Foug A]
MDIMDVDDQRFLPAKRKAAKKQKRRVVSSDEEDEDEDILEADSTAKRRASVTKGKLAASSRTKAKSTKSKGEKEIFIKDERKLPAPTASTSRASSIAAQTHSSDLTANDEAVSTTTTQTLADPATVRPATDKGPTDPPVPKRRKLPTIKKNKLQGTAGTTATSSAPSTAGKPPPLSPSTDDLVKPPVPAIQQRKTALSGTQDLDLSNHQVYASLFKGGGNTPRSGLNRREREEERRKELDRLRDEARAKRAEDAHTFDLQAQADKIARFERRLRAEGSSVLHPNFLAAKFRDEWEMERRRRRDDRGPSSMNKEEAGP